MPYTVKTRRSLTTEIINSGFYCTFIMLLVRVNIRVDLAIELRRGVVCNLLHPAALFLWELLLYLMYRKPF